MDHLQKQSIRDLLTDKFKVRTHYLGFEYLVEAINRAVYDQDAENIYAYVAAKTGKNKENVQKNIRTCCRDSFKHGAEAAWKKYFKVDLTVDSAGNPQDIVIPKPKEYIKSLAGHIIRQKENDKDDKKDDEN